MKQAKLNERIAIYILRASKQAYDQLTFSRHFAVVT